jgi:hypothetical protein
LLKPRAEAVVGEVVVEEVEEEVVEEVGMVVIPITMTLVWLTARATLASFRIARKLQLL